MIEGIKFEKYLHQTNYAGYSRTVGTCWRVRVFSPLHDLWYLRAMGFKTKQAAKAWAVRERLRGTL